MPVLLQTSKPQGPRLRGVMFPTKGAAASVSRVLSMILSSLVSRLMSRLASQDKPTSALLASDTYFNVTRNRPHVFITHGCVLYVRLPTFVYPHNSTICIVHSHVHVLCQETKRNQIRWMNQSENIIERLSASARDPHPNCCRGNTTRSLEFV